MASPRPESKESEKITLDTLMQRLKTQSPREGFFELSSQFVSFLQNDPRVTPELLAQFFIEPLGNYPSITRYLTGNDPITTQFLIERYPSITLTEMDPRATAELLAQLFIERFPSITRYLTAESIAEVYTKPLEYPIVLSLFIHPSIASYSTGEDIDKLINKASPDMLMKVNIDNLTDLIRYYTRDLECNFKYNLYVARERFINPFLSILRTLTGKYEYETGYAFREVFSTLTFETGYAFRKVFSTLTLMTKTKENNEIWLKIDSENYRAMLMALRAEDFQCLTEVACHPNGCPKYKCIFDIIVEIEDKELFQIFLQTLGFDDLAELLGSIRNFHAEQFPFYKKINSIFEIAPDVYVKPKFENNQKFAEYFKLLGNSVNYFREDPAKCISLIIALADFPIESTCFRKNEKFVSALRKIAEHLELNPDPDRLRIVMYVIAKCHYAIFLVKQEKSEKFSEFSSKVASIKPLSKERKESALIDVKEEEKKLVEKRQAELALVVVDQLEYHNRAVEIWLNILPEKLPASVVLASDLVLIGDALRGCIRNSAFQHIKDPVAIQIRALQYYYQAASKNNLDAIQAIELMAADMGVLILPEFKDKQKTEKKDDSLFKLFDRKAEEEKKQSAEPASLDEDEDKNKNEEEASSWKILYAKIIKQLKFQRIENLIKIISQRVTSSDISGELKAMLANLAEARKSKTPATSITKIAKALPDLTACIAKIKIEQNQKNQLTKELNWLKESLITPASSEVSHEMKRSGPAAR